jgi:cysteinyl-tRNA synthetase
VVNFSSEALQAAEKALGRLQDAYMRLQALNPAEKSTEMVPDLMAKCYEALDDDLNTPNVISVLFEAVKIINSAADGLVRLDAGDIARLKELFDVMLGEILGIRLESVGSSSDSEAYKGAVDLLMEIRANAKQAKDWTTSDLIRDKLAALGFSVKDTKNGVEWSVK